MSTTRSNKVTIYVYAEHCTAAGQVVPPDANGEYDDDIMEASDDYIKWADCEDRDDVLGAAQWIMNQPEAYQSARTTARNVYEYLTDA